MSAPKHSSSLVISGATRARSVCLRPRPRPDQVADVASTPEQSPQQAAPVAVRTHSEAGASASLAPLANGLLSPERVIALQRTARSRDADTDVRCLRRRAALSTVRIDTGAEAAALMATRGASTVAGRRHIAIAPPEYRPATPLGDALIARGVAHVLPPTRGGYVPGGSLGG